MFPTPCGRLYYPSLYTKRNFSFPNRKLPLSSSCTVTVVAFCCSYSVIIPVFSCCCCCCCVAVLQLLTFSHCRRSARLDHFLFLFLYFCFVETRWWGNRVFIKHKSRKSFVKYCHQSARRRGMSIEEMQKEQQNIRVQDEEIFELSQNSRKWQLFMNSVFRFKDRDNLSSYSLLSGVVVRIISCSSLS